MKKKRRDKKTWEVWQDCYSEWLHQLSKYISETLNWLQLNCCFAFSYSLISSSRSRGREKCLFKEIKIWFLFDDVTVKSLFSRFDTTNWKIRRRKKWEMNTVSNNCDSGFGSEMNIDNIFFYEDNCNDVGGGALQSMTQYRTLKREESSDQMDGNDQLIDSHESGSSGALAKQKRQKDSKYTQIKVNVGIDEDLKMILEMVIFFCVYQCCMFDKKKSTFAFWRIRVWLIWRVRLSMR